MAPDPGGKEYVVRCALRSAVPDATHFEAIEGAVKRVHKCTLLAMELLNIYVRHRIENHGATGLESIFTQNWLFNAYNARGGAAVAPTEHVLGMSRLKTEGLWSPVPSESGAYLTRTHRLCGHFRFGPADGGLALLFRSGRTKII